MFKILVILTLYLSCFTHVFCNISNRRIFPKSVQKLINPSNFVSTFKRFLQVIKRTVHFTLKESVADNKTIVTLGNKRIIHGKKSLAVNQRFVFGSDVNAKTLQSNNLSKPTPENKQIFSKIQANKKTPSIVVRTFNGTVNLSKLNVAIPENETIIFPSNKSLLDGIESKPKNTSFIVGTQSEELSVNKTVTSLENTTLPPDKIPIKQRSKAKPNNYIDNVTIADNQIAILGENERIIHGSNSKPKLIPSIVPKVDNKTAKLPGNKLVIHRSKKKAKLYPSVVHKPNNNTAKLPGNKRIFDGSKAEPELIPFIVPKHNNNTHKLPENKKSVHGSKTKPKLIPSIVPKAVNKTAKLLGNKLVIRGSKKKAKLYPSAVHKPNNNTAKHPGNKRIIDGSKAEPGLIRFIVPKPNNNTHKLPENKKSIHGSKTKPKLIPSLVSKVNNKTKLPFKADNKTIKIIGRQRIVKGIEAKRQQFPFIVSIRDRKFSAHRCSGSIIDMYHILTAAHCCVTATKNTIDFHKILILAGDINIGKSTSGPNRIYRNPVEVIPHPQYNSITVENDICIIRCSNELTLSVDVQIIPLGISTPKPDQPCEIAGWGAMNESNKTQPLTLRTANLKIIDTAKCNRAYDGMVPRLTVCAGDHTASGVLAKDACQGDSGGPLVCNKILNGIVSFGRGCGDSRFPGIYTDVSQFRTWIESVLNRTHNHTNGDAVMLKSKLSFTLLMVMETILNLVKSY